MSKGCIVTEVAPQLVGNRKWVAIYPAPEGEIRGAYKYFEVELPGYIVERDLDWFESDEITSWQFVADLAGLYDLLETKNLDPETFDVPWKFNYPYHY